MTFQCQVNGSLSAQACGSRKADSIFCCEIIGPHDRCRVGEHTIAHERAGNGYSCTSIQVNLLVAAAPPPTTEQLERLRALLPPIGGQA